MKSMPTLLLFVGLMSGSAAAPGAELTTKRNQNASQDASVAPIQRACSCVTFDTHSPDQSISGAEPVGSHSIDMTDFVRRTEQQNVQELDLTNLQITDIVLQHLKTLTHLQVLHLDGTNITDAGLADLNALKKLQSLYLINTRISGAGIEGPRSDLSKCNIGN